MRISEKSQQIKKWDFLMNDQNIFLGRQPYKKYQKIEKL